MHDIAFSIKFHGKILGLKGVEVLAEPVNLPLKNGKATQHKVGGLTVQTGLVQVEYVHEARSQREASLHTGLARSPTD